MIRIKSIKVFKDTTFSNEIFDWTDEGKALNVFHLKNQSGKTTFYNIVRCLLSGDPLNKKNIDIEIAGSAMLTLQVHDNLTLTLKSDHNCFYFEENHIAVSDISYDQYIIEKVFGKNYVSDKILYYNQEKTSISSLLRFSFFSDEDFQSKDSKISDLIYVEFDGRGKYILLGYVLGGSLKNKKTRNIIFSMINDFSKKGKELKKLQDMLNKDQAKEAKSISEGLFNDIGQKYKETQNEKLILQNLEEIYRKLEILRLKSIDAQLGDNVIQYLNSEISFIGSGMEELVESISKKDLYLSSFPNLEPNDYLTYEQLKSRENKLISESEIIEEELEKGLDFNRVIEEYLKIVEAFYSIFDFQIDISDMKVILTKFSSEGVLKCSKFLANLGFQIFSVKNYSFERKIPLLPIGFYDAIFGGSDIDNIIKCFEVIESINEEVRHKMQIFVCLNRYNRGKNELDEFIEKQDWIYNHKIPEGQKFLFKS